ncbi:bifunctional 3-(3-hydroxy-phenyl)propionate/3-hydroxycinnamic acid hydroxylase [Kribbella sp. NPDC056861]|uniref:bifunctional 3-(3-hydroxy-phenyl)propionate/3-hydroxycinnamic acid hydroxylase n=1 Tax=Kribbella sp. NPDC056861 TaxID=3154857 RepID=UPI00341A5C5F
MSEQDVIVVGCGPVGLVLTALLGKAGHSVLVLERYPGRYGLPRAASFDSETLRTMAALGLAPALLPGLHVQERYEWRNRQGELLIEQVCRSIGDSGWPDMATFHQPDLENALHELCRSLPSVELRFGTTVTAVNQQDDQVVVRTDTGEDFAARYVIGADGGNSFVREALGIGLDDLGFSEPWLVCDFKLRRPAEELGLPGALQIGDPDEPTTIITTGSGHQRFCFMLDTEADLDVERSKTRAWERVRRYLSTDDADLVRVADYTFRSLIAHQWRDRRVLLAGDAAHQMPPFLGQGLCSGIRDAGNIAFKLDWVLRGVHDSAVLDTYQTEREPHVRAITATSMRLGRQHTLRDPVLAAERDEELRTRRAALVEPDRIRLPGLGPGFFGPGGRTLSVQGRASNGRMTALLDELVGSGFRLLATEDALADIDPEAVSTAGITLVGLGAQAQGVVLSDVDGTHYDWLRSLGATAAVVRPDNYVLVSGQDAAEVSRRAIELLAPDAMVDQTGQQRM